MKIKEVLQRAVEKLSNEKMDSPIQKARILLAYTLNVQKEFLIIHDKDEIEYETLKRYNEIIEALINSKPLQYITNHQEFMKMDFYVDENVLIPRADTEILVEEVIEYAKRNRDSNYKVLDLCSGSGAIGISIAKYVKNSNVTCVDISLGALEVAKKNASTNKVENVTFIHSDMFENVNDKFDVIVSNPPYIRRDEIKCLDMEVQNEPYIALNGGEDGLDFYRVIISNAYKYLNKNGGLFLEIGYDQKEDVINLLEKNGMYNKIHSKKDLYGNDRVIMAY